MVLSTTQSLIVTANTNQLFSEAQFFSLSFSRMDEFPRTKHGWRCMNVWQTWKEPRGDHVCVISLADQSCSMMSFRRFPRSYHHVDISCWTWNRQSLAYRLRQIRCARIHKWRKHGKTVTNRLIFVTVILVWLRLDQILGQFFLCNANISWLLVSNPHFSHMSRWPSFSNLDIKTRQPIHL